MTRLRSPRHRCFYEYTGACSGKITKPEGGRDAGYRADSTAVLHGLGRCEMHGRAEQARAGETLSKRRPPNADAPGLISPSRATSVKGGEGRIFAASILGR